MKKRLIFTIAVSLLLTTLLYINFNKPKIDTSDYEVVFEEEFKLSASGSKVIDDFLAEIGKLESISLESIYAGCWLDEDFYPHVGLTGISEEISSIAKKYELELVLQNFSYKELSDLSSSFWDENTPYREYIISKGIDESKNVIDLTIIHYDEMLSKFPDIVEQLERDPRIEIFKTEVIESTYVATGRDGDTNRVSTSYSISFTTKKIVLLVL